MVTTMRRLTRRNTPGFYYVDQNGGHWATVSRGGGLLCGDCGCRFTNGYERADAPMASCGCRLEVNGDAPMAHPDPDPNAHYHLEQRLHAPGSTADVLVPSRVRRDGAFMLVRLGVPYLTLAALNANRPADKPGVWFESVYCSDPECPPDGGYRQVEV